MEERKAAILAEIPRLRRYARALLRDRDAADDLVQDCLERALARIDNWRTGESPRRWLFTIMHHLFVDQMRKTKRRAEVVMLTLDDSEALSSPAEQAESVASREIMDALQAISPDRRAALRDRRHRRIFLCRSRDDARRSGRHADVADRARPRGIARPARRCRAPAHHQGGRTMSRREFTERDIHMALDGELPEEERADYEAWLDANPEMKARSVRFEADRTRLRRHLRRRSGRAARPTG